MKFFFTIILILFFTLKVKSQNYEPILVDSNISFYVGFNGNIEGVKIISANKTGNTFNYELSKTWNSNDINCIKPNGPSWLGKFFNVINNQFQFFNYNGDTIFFHPKPDVGTEWKFYTYADSSYIKAKIERKSQQLLLNVFDSFIEYSFNFYNKYDSLIDNRFYNNNKIRISKNNGAIGMIIANSFPNTLQFMNLCGVTRHKIGYNFLSWKKIYNFEIGDEFHYDELNVVKSPDDCNLKTIKKIIDKKYSFEDTNVTYTSRRILFKDFFDNTKTDTYKIDTISETYLIKEEEIFVKGEPKLSSVYKESEGPNIQWNNGHNRYQNEIINVLKGKHSDTCWYTYSLTPNYYATYLEGCGVLKFELLNMPTGRFEINLIHYKKGNITFGLPFVNLSNEDILNQSIKFYPNPILNTQKLFIENVSSKAVLTIINIIGESVLNKAIDVNENQIDISGLKTGIYFIKVANSKNQIYIQKLIIN